LGYSPDQIEQDRTDRIEEALLMATVPPVPTIVQERLEGQAPGTQPLQTEQGGAPNGQQPQPSKPQRQNGKKASPTPNSGGLQPGGGRR
jgi:hypothetical protein